MNIAVAITDRPLTDAQIDTISVFGIPIHLESIDSELFQLVDPAPTAADDCLIIAKRIVRQLFSMGASKPNAIYINLRSQMLACLVSMCIERVSNSALPLLFLDRNEDITIVTFPKTRGL